MTIGPRFNRLYRDLIKEGYYPRYQKIAKGVILRKAENQKRDYSRLKAYRIISLLNYLGKILEKILARRLSILIELPSLDLLYFDQMGSRQRKLSINLVLLLVHNIQAAKNRNKKTSTIFMDVKGAFNHISTNQLLKISIKLGLPISLIKWIYLFLSNRKIILAFDGELSQIMPIEVGIP